MRRVKTTGREKKKKSHLPIRIPYRGLNVYDSTNTNSHRLEFIFICLLLSRVRANKISANLFNIKLCSTNFFCHSFILDIRHNKHLVYVCTLYNANTTHQSTFDKRVCHFFTVFFFNFSFCIYFHLFAVQPAL